MRHRQEVKIIKMQYMQWDGVSSDAIDGRGFNDKWDRYEVVHNVQQQRFFRKLCGRMAQRMVNECSQAKQTLPMVDFMLVSTPLPPLSTDQSITKK